MKDSVLDARVRPARMKGDHQLPRLEAGKLIATTRGTRNEACDRCLLLLMFRHGLRVSAACRLKLNQVDTHSHVLHIVRLKRGYQPRSRYAATSSR